MTTSRATAAAVLVAVSAGLPAARFSFDADTFRDCAYLGPSARMYVTAWAGPLCSAAALVVAVRGMRRLSGGRVVLVCGGVLLLAVQLLALYWVYAPDPAGGTGCSG
ncbi:hypothetical protein GTY65_12185 [Streptomyces sp. SID8379]|uniref:hypothetical protein n=1 Tax=unclassified Streptomyces TaxID=2593676 RepID=UPI0003815714|nr:MULTISPECIES: hypothetical protein [unclassified Streptomyces]MYW64818.1 hypothetical protein [Streptomyces sp. SID8379]